MTIRGRRDPRRLSLAWAGRLATGKGLDELLTAVALLTGRRRRAAGRRPAAEACRREMSV